MNRQGERGFVLVAALWMLAMLAALASAYAMFAINTAANVYLPQERLKVDAAIRAAIEITAFRQLSWPTAARPSQGAFTAKVGAATIEVRYRTESARIDVNIAPRAELASLFAATGATAATADFLAQRIVAWRGRLQPAEQRAEAQIYRQAGLGYAPVGAPFDNVLELAALPNMSGTLLARALPYLTVYNNSGAIDPMVAEPIVLAAVPGMTPEIERALRKAVSGGRPNPLTLATVAGPTRTFVGIGSNDAVRAQIVVTLPNRTISAEVVVLAIAAADEPFQILYWRDNFDG